jgi:hypothetical protein
VTTAERRLAAIEAALTPIELVVRLLEEAHSFGALEAWVRSLLADPNVIPPLDQLARAASDGTRTRLKGKPAEELNKAIDTAVGETVFRFELVLRINTTSQELLDRQMLLDPAFAAQLAMLMHIGADQRERGPGYLVQPTQLRDLIVGRVDELEAATEARHTVEERYLAGGRVAEEAEHEPGEVAHDQVQFERGDRDKVRSRCEYRGHDAEDRELEEPDQADADDLAGEQLAGRSVASTILTLQVAFS